MRNLLSANFARLWRCVWFWLGGLGILGYTLWELSEMFSWALGPNGGHPADYLSSRIADFTVPLFLILAALCPLFLNEDYHNGTLRNKIVVGRTRAQVYLANYFALLAAALFYAAVHVALSVGAVCLVKSHIWVWEDTAKALLPCLPYILGITALFTLLGMLVRSRAVSIVAILLAVGLLWLPQHLFRHLCILPAQPDWDKVTQTLEPNEEGDFDLVYWQDGRRVEEDDLEMIPDPRYVDEPLRSLYYFGMEAFPGGQAFLLCQSLPLERGSPGLLAAYSLGLFVLAGGGGLLAFRRMDLK
ncbi:hypothetical protein D7X94_09425 [Acutalibacter sp. 1XD8-33]|uniref:ABC transporter permease subunit n=1 Tax=Acutalibacter sp. 1XD8-33 TaxID=2320081 RepID=UPI000EA1DDD5|nr:ABC transporter permease subunit [Acutalibacter sp. 1XD8-33]RKJ40077.1 hypothetical protein D7X94_09425 [Acutalibacter sp. 1XD8-33]